MKWNPFRKKKESIKKTKWQEWRDSVVFAVVVAALFRWSLVEAFVIPTPSMENSLLVGDFLFVSKFHYGARTPRTPLQIPLTHQKIWGTEIPSYLTWIQLPSYRLPGLRSVKRGEPVVFNVPKDLLDPTERPVDLKTYLVKRCVAIPGDQFEIRDRQIFINGQPMVNPEGMKWAYRVYAKDEIHQRNLNRFGLDRDDYFFEGRTQDGKALYMMYLTQKQVIELKSSSFIESVEEQERGEGDGIFPVAKQMEWTANKYGPLMIPAKGMKMTVNKEMLSVYGEIIRLYEGNKNVTIANDALQIDGKTITDYTFQQDYYFMMGDNRDNSLDSRYWGFVPQDHILGKPLFIWLSIDHQADILHKIRWERLFTLID
jgi:signal peptidase I